MSEKIQKVLSHFGYGSRREIETWLSAGLIHINSKLAKLGDRMERSDAVSIKGRRVFLSLEESPPPRVLLYYKPEGLVCTRDDPEGRETVFQALPRPKNARWIMVGRLDLNTSGLLLFTTDGELANALMHPKHQVEREYAVRLYGTLTPEHINALKNGIMLEDGPAVFKEVFDRGGEGQNHWYHVVITEGRNREIRRMFDHFELQVSRLIRVRYGSIHLPHDLARGQMCDLPYDQLKLLYQNAGLPIPAAPKFQPKLNKGRR